MFQSPNLTSHTPASSVCQWCDDSRSWSGCGQPGSRHNISDIYWYQSGQQVDNRTNNPQTDRLTLTCYKISSLVEAADLKYKWSHIIQVLKITATPLWQWPENPVVEQRPSRLSSVPSYYWYYLLLPGRHLCIVHPRCIDAADSAHSLSGFLPWSNGLLSSAACSRKSALPLPSWAWWLMVRC